MTQMMALLRPSATFLLFTLVLAISFIAISKGRSFTDNTDEEDEKMLTKRSTSTELLSYDLALYHKNATRFRTTKLFVSVGLASTIFHRVGKNSFAVEGNRLFFNLAAAMSPSIVRVGGTRAGFLVFEPDNVAEPVSDENKEAFEAQFNTSFWSGEINGFKHFNVTSYEWERVHRFFMDVGWLLNFNLDAFMFNNKGQANLKNTRYLLKFCNKTGLPFYGFQYFNEPNSYGHKFNGFKRSPEQLKKDWTKLAALQNEEAYSFVKDTLRIGPDVTSISLHPSSRNYLDDFFKIGGADVQDVLGLHHYYFDGPTATLEDYMNSTIFDTLGETVRMGRALCDKYKPEMPIHLSESSDGWGGGSNTFSPAFVSVFVFMDMLGQAALYGAEVVNKYTYYSGAYGMVGANSKPNPNYWIALAHKQLIEGPVLVANISGTEDKLFRTYAHCIREDFHYNGRTAKIGGVVIIYINLRDANVTLTNMPFPTKDVHKYVFHGEPGVDDTTMFMSSNMFLNGFKLETVSDCVPSLHGEVLVTPESVTVPRYSTGFLVYPWASAYDCKYSRTPSE